MDNELNLATMKNILIVNSRASSKKMEGFVMWGAWSVASYFKKEVKDADVIFLDENNEDNFLDKFKQILPSRDTVGFSLTSMQIKYSLPLIKYVKDNFPQIKVIVGGIHPILFPDQDYGKLVDKVITYDLPKTNFDYNLLPDKVKNYFHKRGQVVTGFNCSFKCAFCVNSIRNCRYESVPLEKILANIDYIAKEYHPSKIYFRDEHFFQDINKARAIVEYILEKEYKFGWDTSARVTDFVPGRIDEEFLKKLVTSGCYVLRFGVESGSQRMLNYLRKGQTVEQIKSAIKQCAEHKINASCSMLIGIPGETAADREETYKLIEELNSYGKYVQILGPQLYRPYPGGILYEEIKKYGFKFPEKFEDWAAYYDNQKNPTGDVFDSSADFPWLTPKENKVLPNVFVVAHYGLNYLKQDSLIKKIIGAYFLIHWKLRWFGGPDLKLFMKIRKKFLKDDKDEG